MASIESLEALGNKSLREKCNEYGLPNIPVTDTSRKLLIKRLVKAIETGDKPISEKVEKPKSRRETVHVIKVNIEEEPVKEKRTPSKAKSSSNRRTIGPIKATTNFENDFTSEDSIIQKRRSGRISPLSQSKATPQSAMKRKVDAVIQEDDDEDYSIPIPVIIEKTTPEIQRQTREPSLSKSVTVTTSYVRDSPTPQREIVEEIDPVGEDEEEEEEDDYDEEEEEYEEDKTEILEPEPVIEPTKFKYMSTSRTYDTSKPFVPSPDKVPPYVYNSPTLLNRNPPPSRISLSQQSSSASTSTPRPYESTTTRRFVTGGYKDSRIGENKTFVHHHPDEDEKDSIESPYLSRFTQRLSYLKAESSPGTTTTPLSGGKIEEKLYRQSPYYSSSRISARRSLSQNESIGESLKQFFSALDRKYHLKRNCIIIAIILAIILIYVLFFEQMFS